MNLQIETVTTTAGKMDVVRDIEMVRRLVSENERLRDFVEALSRQRPEKPDYWSSCGQCDRNIDAARELLSNDQAQAQTPRS